MIALSVMIINYLAREISQSLSDKGVKAEIKGFDFEALKKLGIEEINNFLNTAPTSTVATSTVTSTISTSTGSISTSTTSTSPTSTTSTVSK